MAYTTNWQHIESRIGFQGVKETDTVATCALGQISRAKDFGNNSNGLGEFIYLKGVANTVVGSWVIYNADDGSTNLLVPDAIGPIAVAMSACVLGQYGWYQIQGKAVARAAVGYADNANVYATATPGVVNSAVVAGDRVKEAKGASAVDFPATGLAEFEIHRPFADDAVAA